MRYAYLGSVRGYANNLSINRPDRTIRSLTTYLRLDGLVQTHFIQAPIVRLSTLNPFAKLRADIERGTLNELLTPPRGRAVFNLLHWFRLPFDPPEC